jgi:hypothetical protein
MASQSIDVAALAAVLSSMGIRLSGVTRRQQRKIKAQRSAPAKFTATMVAPPPPVVKAKATPVDHFARIAAAMKQQTAPPPAPAPAQQKYKSRSAYQLTEEEEKCREENKRLDGMTVLEYVRDNAPAMLPYIRPRGQWLWVVDAPKPTEEQGYHLRLVGFTAKKTRRGWEWSHPCGVAKKGFKIDSDKAYGTGPAVA